MFKFAFMVVFNYLPDSGSITESVGNIIHYRITATPQIPDCHQQWNIRSDSRIFSPGQAYAWLSSSATTLFSGVLCASKFCPCRENFLWQWHNHVGTQSTHVECCSGDTSLLEMQFSLVSTRCRASHCRSYDSSLYACSTLWLELFFYRAMLAQSAVMR